MHCTSCTCDKPKKAPKFRAPSGNMTPAKAARFRAEGARLCGCTLCLWSLQPAQTLAEHAERIAATEAANAAGWPTAHRDWAALQKDGK